MNLVGAAGFVVNGWWHGALPSATLNVVWLLFAAGHCGRIWNAKRLVDLSHLIEHGMTTYQGPAGAAYLRLLDARGSAANYDDGSSFQIGRIDMVANTGTYLDAPFHRYADGADLAGLALEQLAALPGLVVRADAQAVDAGAVRGPRRRRQGGAGPHRLGPALAHRRLCARAIPSSPKRRRGCSPSAARALVGIDSYNIDDTGAPRPPGPHHPARRRRPDLRAYDQSRRAARRAASPSPPCRRRSPAWAPSRCARSPDRLSAFLNVATAHSARRQFRRRIDLAPP